MAWHPRSTERAPFTTGALDVLPAGSIPPNPAEVAASAAVADILRELAASHDVVLVDVVLGWHPYARKGYAFRPKGRGAGPIRTAIACVLKRFMPRNLRNLALFDAVASNLPHGWHATQSPKRLIGPRIGDGMDWPRFRTVASEERKKLGLGRKRKSAKNK